ncbi:MAG: BACON domain-containing protein [Fermentimonas sp.]|jgi:hypothetical protein
MKRLRFFTVLSVALFLGLSLISCEGDDNEPDVGVETSLSLSKDELLVSNQPQETEEIIITTDNSKVKAFSSAGWLKVDLKDKTLQLSVGANENTKDRTAYVIVTAGNQRKKVTVTQSSADIVLGVSPQELNVSSKRQDIYIAISSNKSDWTFEQPKEEWIEVEKKSSSLLKLTIAENKDEENSRRGSVYVKVDDKLNEVTIIQEALDDNQFIMPLLERYVTVWDVTNFEKNRQNHILYSSTSMLSSEETYTFTCNSSVVEQITYKFDQRIRAVKGATISSMDGEALLSDEYRKYLTDYGFELGEKTNSGYDGVFKKEGLIVNLRVRISQELLEFSTVEFEFTPIQIGKFPTFNAFPYDRSVYFDNPTEYGYERIKQIELDEGGTIIKETPFKYYPDVIRALEVRVAESKHPLAYRLIIMEDNYMGPTDQLGSLLCAWDDVTLGARPQDGVYVLTDEFKELLAKEGFVKVDEYAGKDYYYKKEKKLVIVPYADMFPDILGEKMTFVIEYYIDDYYDDYDDYMSSDSNSLEKREALRERIKQQREMLGGKYNSVE